MLLNAPLMSPAPAQNAKPSGDIRTSVDRPRRVGPAIGGASARVGTTGMSDRENRMAMMLKSSNSWGVPKLSAS